MCGDRNRDQVKSLIVCSFAHRHRLMKTWPLFSFLVRQARTFRLPVDLLAARDTSGCWGHIFPNRVKVMSASKLACIAISETSQGEPGSAGD